jgi:hypothetical protein
MLAQWALAHQEWLAAMVAVVLELQVEEVVEAELPALPALV